MLQVYLLFKMNFIWLNLFIHLKLQVKLKKKSFKKEDDKKINTSYIK